MLTGRSLFAGPDYGSVLQKLKAHAEATPPSMAKLRDDVPQRCPCRGLHVGKRADHRYPNAKVLAESLEEFSGDADVARLVAGVAGPPAEDQQHRSTITFRCAQHSSIFANPAFWRMRLPAAAVILAIALGSPRLWRPSP